ncbi:pentapeptide repeat-containing protein [Winslowiella toletana]
MDNVKVIASNIDELTFINCNINQFIMQDCLAKNLRFQQGELRASHWQRCLIEGMVLEKTQIAKMRISDVQLANWVALSLPATDFTVSGGKFKDASWFASRIEQGRWQQVEIHRLAMSQCELEDVVWQDISGGHAVWNQCELSQVVLSGLSLPGSSFYRSRLTHCDLSGSNLAHGVFTRSQLSDCQLSGANMTACMADNAQFVRCNFVGATMATAQMAGCSLQHCRVSGCDLSQADLRAADVSTTPLHEAAQTAGVRLHGATLGPAEQTVVKEEPVLTTVDAWYQYYQPGIPSDSPLSSQVLPGGSRNV